MEPEELESDSSQFFADIEESPELPKPPIAAPPSEARTNTLSVFTSEPLSVNVCIGPASTSGSNLPVETTPSAAEQFSLTLFSTYQLRASAGTSISWNLSFLLRLTVRSFEMSNRRKTSLPLPFFAALILFSETSQNACIQFGSFCMRTKYSASKDCGRASGAAALAAFFAAGVSTTSTSTFLAFVTAFTAFFAEATDFAVFSETFAAVFETFAVSVASALAAFFTVFFAGAALAATFSATAVGFLATLATIFCSAAFAAGFFSAFAAVFFSAAGFSAFAVAFVAFLAGAAFVAAFFTISSFFLVVISISF